MNLKKYFSKRARQEDLSRQLRKATVAGDVKKLQRLIKRGVNINEHFGMVGTTPLMKAAKLNHAGFVRALADAGAKLNLTENLLGDTALDVAEMYKSEESAAVLREKGAQRSYWREREKRYSRPRGKPHTKHDATPRSDIAPDTLKALAVRKKPRNFRP